MAERAVGEPTEAPTPRRLEEARSRGQVARSADLSGALVFAAVTAALAGGGAALVGGLLAYLHAALGGAAAGGDGTAALGAGLGAGARALALPLGVAFVAALGSGLLQTRGLVSWQALAPDARRLSPARGLGRILSGQALGEIGKGLLKVVVVAALAASVLRPRMSALTGLVGRRPAEILAALGELTLALAGRVALALLALGVLDYLWQRRRHAHSLRMTRDEVKREHKESEGDPQHKAERQRLHRELATLRMVADVRRADFVVVNPEHVAVAVRYDGEENGAPVVVAKGDDQLAQRIKEEARAAGVPIFRDVALARSLREVEEGDEIPEALFQAVAELLRVVQGFPAGSTGGGAGGGAAADDPGGAAAAARAGSLGGGGDRGTAGPPASPPAGWKRA